MSLFTKILGDPNEREVKKLEGTVESINSLEPEIESLSDAQLRNKTNELRKQIDPEAPAPLEALLPMAFALVREASKRTLGQRHFDAQLMGA